jgi:hypothetical protein
MILRSIVVLIAVCLPVFGAPDRNKAAEIQKTIQGLKATVAQLQDQISVLEAQLASAEKADTPREQPAVSTSSTMAMPLAVEATTAVPDSTRGRTTQPAAVKVNDTARQQCSATTQRGTRCSRMAAVGRSTCWQHGR